MRTFILIERPFYKTVEWFGINAADESKLNLPYNKRGNIKLFNPNGGYNFLLPEDKILEIAHAENWEFIDKLENRKKTSFYKELVRNSKNNTLRHGWLDPQGKMHFCRYTDHDNYVYVVLGDNIKNIEKKGWLRIHDLSYYTTKRMTQAQANTLRGLGCNVYDEDIMQS